MFLIVLLWALGFGFKGLGSESEVMTIVSVRSRYPQN